jgi:predicted acylesterase/phospholipase RssA
LKECSYGLALEGGGARGAYQVGAYKALVEANIQLKAIVGTSIGAINAAVICSGGLELLEENIQDFWYYSL